MTLDAYQFSPAAATTTSFCTFTSTPTSYLVEPFQYRHKRHRLATYNHIMTRPKKRGHTVNLKVINYESIQTYMISIEDKRD